jgi:uncharacterized coiled-coil protein SlyX
LNLTELTLRKDQQQVDQLTPQLQQQQQQKQTSQQNAIQPPTWR